METKIFKIDPLNINRDIIRRASEIIQNRGLVAFPTETVYGLGANALDPKAVTKVFEAKKRPFDDPIILHISTVEDLYKLVEDVPPEAIRIINRFWPGPLTMILKKTDLVPDIVTTGFNTVAIRMPSNPVARELIKACGVPIAAPSANLFGRPSPTKAHHVLEDLSGRIDCIIDGGDTEIGVESTVIEFTSGPVKVLRPGGIDIEDINLIVRGIEMVSESEDIKKSPGWYPQHYSPQANVTIVNNSVNQVEDVLEKAKSFVSKGDRVGIMAKQEHENHYKNFVCKIIGPEKDLRTCAARLFSLLREFDQEKVDIIIAEGISEEGIGLAVMNRLRKAAGPEIASSDLNDQISPEKKISEVKIVDDQNLDDQIVEERTFDDQLFDDQFDADQTADNRLKDFDNQ